MSIPLYQVIDYGLHFENAKSRAYAKCTYVCVPNKHGGAGVSMVQGEPDGDAIYGNWMWLVQVLSRQMPPREGYLTADGKKDGRRLSVRELAMLFRRPEAAIHRLLQVTSSPEVGFIRIVDGEPESAQQSLTRTSRIPGGYPKDSEYPQTIPTVSAEYPPSIPEVSSAYPIPDGQLTDTSSSYAVLLDCNRKKERKEELSPDRSENPDSETPQLPVASGIPEVSLKYPSPDTSGPLPDTSGPLPDTSGPLPDTSGPLPDTASSSTDTIETGDEAKLLFSELCEAAFGYRYKPSAWDNLLEHRLVDALPMQRADFALIDWAYRLNQTDPGHAIFATSPGRIGLSLRQSFDALIEHLPAEVQKIRRARKTIGMNGLHAAVDGGARVEPPGWRAIYELEYPTATDWPESFWGLTKTVREELPVLRKKFKDVCP